MIFNDLLDSVKLVDRYLRQSSLHLQLKRQGARVAPSARIIGNCEIVGKVEIGASTIILESFLDGRGGLKIGQNAILGRTTIITAGHNFDSPDFETTFAPVVVGDYAVLLMRSIVLPGRRIGQGAVVAAGAVVTWDVPDMAIVAGNPARVIRQRACVHSEADLLRMVGFGPRRLNLILARLRFFLSGLHT